MRVPSQMFCTVTRSPSCGRLHRQTVKPLPPPNRLFFHVSFWLDGPWRRHSLKRRQHHEDAMAARTERPKNRAFWTVPFGTTWQSFFLCTRLPEGWQKKNRKNQKAKAFSCGRTIQWALKSDRPDPVLGSFWQIRTHAMMWNRDHLGEFHHVIV